MTALGFNLRVMGSVPAGTQAEADAARETIIAAVEKALQPLDRHGIYLDAMTYATEAKGGQSVAGLISSSLSSEAPSSGVVSSELPVSPPASTSSSSSSPQDSSSAQVS